MNLVEMDETLALANVDAAVTQKKPVVFFCYTPHHMFALHELVILKEPPYDAAKWNVLQPTDDPDWLAKSSAAWPGTWLICTFTMRRTRRSPAGSSSLAVQGQTRYRYGSPR